MQIKSVLFLLFCVYFIITFAGTAWGQTSVQKCSKQLSPLKKTKEAIIGDGGMWGIFERHKQLRDKSNKAIQLDNKIQQLVWLLDYLCTTADGVPLNELATYLTENLKEKSKQQFKKELIILGKSEAEIDLWFVFSEISLKNETRKLNVETICISIQKALPLLLKYEALAKEVDQSPHEKQIKNVDVLYKEIEQLESSDPYLAQALLETSQVPHWDIDESTGGS
ncbi:MAG: hypothetical protein MJD61_00415 [Proteobacteria bacterium]|nr:hypothetical protein [Pseudomonadota bacterium]